jgi:hypothetical protein
VWSPAGGPDSSPPRPALASSSPSLGDIDAARAVVWVVVGLMLEGDGCLRGDGGDPRGILFCMIYIYATRFGSQRELKD